METRPRHKRPGGMPRPFRGQRVAPSVGSSVVGVDCWVHVTHHVQDLCEHAFHACVVASLQVPDLLQRLLLHFFRDAALGAHHLPTESRMHRETHPIDLAWLDRGTVSSAHLYDCSLGYTVCVTPPDSSRNMEKIAGFGSGRGKLSGKGGLVPAGLCCFSGDRPAVQMKASPQPSPRAGKGFRHVFCVSTAVPTQSLCLPHCL